MTDFTDSEPLRASGNSRRMWKLWIIGFLVVVGLLIGSAYWLPSPQVATEAVTYIRNADGSYSVEGDAFSESGLELAINAGTLEADNGISVSSSLSHTGAAWFSSDSIMVINHADHLLVQRAADSLVEALKKDNQFHSVQYYPSGTTPQSGKKSPDLFLTIDLDSVECEGIASSKLQAEIEVTLGNSISRSNHSYFDGLSLPCVDFHSNIRLTHQSTFQGVESSGAKFQLQGQNIGERLAREVTEKLRELRSEHQQPPILPATFHPEAEGIPDFKFLGDSKAELVFSGFGPMIKNETTWRVEGAQADHDLLKSVYFELTSLDWKGGPPSETSRYLRMSTDGQTLTVYPQKATLNNEAVADEARKYWVRYQSLLTKSERSAAFESLLSEGNDNATTLLALKGMASAEQHRRMIVRMETHPPASVGGWTMLARHYFHRKQQEKAVRALQCAYLLHELKQGGDQSIQNLIRQQKLKKSEVLTITPESLKRIGAVDATELHEKTDVKVGPEKIAAIAAQDSKGEWNIVALAFGPRKSATGTLDHTFIQIANYGSSWSSGTWHGADGWERIETVGEYKVKMSTSPHVESMYPDAVSFEIVSRPSKGD